MKKGAFIFLFVIFLFSTLSFSDGFLSSEEYRISQGDLLEIFNYGYPDLTQNVTVGPDGNISVRLVGSIKAAGFTSSELSQTLKEAFYEYAPESRISVIIEKYTPQILLVSGEVKNPSQIDLLMKKNITLLEAISICGGPSNEADLSNVVVIDEEGNSKNYDISPVFDSGRQVEQVFLSQNHIVIVPKKYEKRVYVYGDIQKSGVVYFEESEPMNLSKLLSKMGFDISQLNEKITVFRNGNALNMTLDKSGSNNEFVQLNNNDTIMFKNTEKKFVYVTGLFNKSDKSGIVDFQPEENFTLRNLLGKLGIDPDYLDEINVQNPEGTVNTFTGEHLKYYDESLNTGDFVRLPAEKFVYVTGTSEKNGKIDFDYYEILSLKNLVSKIGFENNFKSKIKVTTPDNTIFEYGQQELNGSEIFLKSASIVEFPYQRYVYALGDTINAENPILFGNSEEMSLKTLIARVNGLNEEFTMSIRIMRNGEEYGYDAQSVLLSDTEITLETGDIVYFEKNKNNFVYVISENSKTLKMEFGKSEDMTLFELLVKLGEIPETVDKNIKIFKSNGNVVMANIDDILSKKEHLSLDPETVVVLPRTTKSVYAFGLVQNGGRIYFGRDEEFTLNILISKVQADLSQNLNSIVIKSNSSVREIIPLEMENQQQNIYLNSGDIVYFKPFIASIVNVFGSVKSPGEKRFAKNEKITLMTVLAKSGGFLDNSDTTLKLIKSNGYIEKIEYSDLKNPDEYILESGDTLIVSDNTEKYVTVLGDVKNAGIFYLKKDSYTLLEILGLAGGVLDWSVNTSIELSRTDGRKEFINSEEDPAKLNEIIIYTNDVVYVLPSEKLKVYVFGEVNRPGLIAYHPGISLLEAFLACGGNTENAHLNEVLYFDGGLNTTPKIVDLTRIKQKMPSEQLLLKPGDVIYVPESAIVDITKVITFLSQMVQFTNNGITLYNNVVDLTKPAAE